MIQSQSLNSIFRNGDYFVPQNSFEKGFDLPDQKYRVVLNDRFHYCPLFNRGVERLFEGPNGKLKVYFFTEC